MLLCCMRVCGVVRIHQQVRRLFTCAGAKGQKRYSKLMLRRIQWGAEEEEEDTRNATALRKVRNNPSFAHHSGSVPHALAWHKPQMSVPGKLCGVSTSMLQMLLPTGSGHLDVQSGVGADCRARMPARLCGRALWRGRPSSASAWRCAAPQSPQNRC
jgi:hypothetical protein